MEKDHGDHLDSKNGCMKQLILDMSVRWSSTYGMLHRAVMLQTVKCHYSKINKHSTDHWLAFQSVDTFVSHMARNEPDRTKRAKLDDLQLSREEWDRVKLFLSLLKVWSVRKSVHSCTLILSCLANISMLMLRSKHFHQTMVHRYISHCPLWKLCMMRGHHEHGKTSIITLRPHWIRR